MGTSISGRGGAGSGIRAGSGRAGSYRSSGGEMGARPFKSNDIKKEVKEILTELFGRASSYTREMFRNAYVKEVYSELFHIAKLLFAQDSEDKVEKIGQEYNLDMDNHGFIFDLMDEIHKKNRQLEVDSRCIPAARQSLEEFFTRAIMDDPDLLIGTGREVVTGMSGHIAFWKSLSGHFLSIYANNVLKMDMERKIKNANFVVREEIECRTNQVIASYKQLTSEGRTDYKKLFEYIEQEWDWFKKEMTK